MSKLREEKSKMIVNAICKELKIIRLYKEYPQEKVASEMNITRAFLSNLENGRIDQFKFITVLELCDYYNVTLSELITRTKNNKPTMNI